MKSEDFERLKAVCEKEGYILEPHNDRYFIITPKDPWEGVEFLRSIWSNKIYPISQVNEKIRHGVKQDDWEISTESSYIEQLKKEAFERFGEIQDGDRFDCSSMGKGTCPITFKQGECDWTYIKEDDRLRKGYFDLYQSGKWAIRVKERVKVKFDGGNLQSRHFFFIYGKDAEHKMVDLGCFKVGQFLASQLEEYLNK